MDCFLNSRLLSKLLIVSYIIAGLTFISMPAFFYLLDSDHRWQLPLAMKIIGIDHASHPGYEIHYAYCIITISYGAIVIAGILWLSSRCMQIEIESIFSACDLTFFYLSFYAMYRLVVCEWYCEQIGQTLHESRRILLKSIRSHVDVFEYLRFCHWKFCKMDKFKLIVTVSSEKYRKHSHHSFWCKEYSR